MTGMARCARRFASPFLAYLVLVASLSLATAQDVTSGPCDKAEAPCKVPLGSYYIALPETPLPPGKLRPAVLFFHGAGGMGMTVLEPGSYLRPFVDAGYAVIGANGLVRPGNAFGAGWSFRPQGPQQRDELAFAKEVLADATGRFGLDARKVLVTGFSIGGSLAWYLACREPGLAAAYAPVAGGFWRPHPTACAGPVDLLQTHGWRDRTVPLEGRPLRGGELYQGDIFEGLQLWRSVNGCKGLRPDSFATDAIFWQRTWSACESGRELSLALHPGDHDAVPMEWATMARLWFEARLKTRPDTN
jgi:polyhydroxybutyrate depolymerase